jgi:hypothetical protein
MRLIFPLIILLLVAGCRKNDDLQKPNFEVAFWNNGAKESFTPFYSSIQPNGSTPGKTDFMLVCRSSDNKNQFAITIQVPGDFHIGTYESNNTNYTVIADYFKNVGQAEERDYTIDHAPTMPTCSFVVTITSIYEKQITGSFTGNYLYDRNNDESIVISDGSFVAKRH